MDKIQVKKELMRFCGDRPFISLTELRKAMHVGSDGASAIVSGLFYIKNGNRKDYLVDDVAERIVERKVYWEG